MTTVNSFINRLRRIGIEVELFGNYPWIYLDSVNGVQVKERFMAEHGFTAFFVGTGITDITIVFNKIREIVNE